MKLSSEIIYSTLPRPLRDDVETLVADVEEAAGTLFAVNTDEEVMIPFPYFGGVPSENDFNRLIEKIRLLKRALYPGQKILCKNLGGCNAH